MKDYIKYIKEHTRWSIVIFFLVVINIGLLFNLFDGSYNIKQSILVNVVYIIVFFIIMWENKITNERNEKIKKDKESIKKLVEKNNQRIYNNFIDEKSNEYNIDKELVEKIINDYNNIQYDKIDDNN